MAWAVAAIAILGLGVPIGAWIYTRRRPLPPVSRLGTGYDPIDQWLLHRHGLPPLDRARVRRAVFEGRQVGDPALAPAARDLAAKVLAGDFGARHMAPALAWFNMVMAAGFAVRASRCSWSAAMPIRGHSAPSLSSTLACSVSPASCSAARPPRSGAPRRRLCSSTRPQATAPRLEAHAWIRPGRAARQPDRTAAGSCSGTSNDYAKGVGATRRPEHANGTI